MLKDEVADILLQRNTNLNKTWLGRASVML